MTSTAFKSLTDTTFDSVEGYRKAHEKAKSTQLKQALQQLSGNEALVIQLYYVEELNVIEIA